jgi:predicted nucleotide-binding protein
MARKQNTSKGNGSGTTEEAKIVTTRAKRSYLKQSDVPKLSLSEALRLPQSLHDDFADKSAAPHQLAMAVDISPTSSAWEDLTGASMAYGLTEGGSNAAEIRLSDLGKRIVAPTEEGQDTVAKVEAALKPTILRRFFDKYNRSKFPQDKIARNVLAEMGVPHDRLDKVLEIVMRNGEYTGVIHQTKTGPFVAVDTPLPRADHEDDETEGEEEQTPAATTTLEETAQPALPATLAPTTTTTPKVFITHGKNEQILKQLEELLKFGKFEPVIAKEHETVAKPVPDKVIEEMRGCSAAVIHVATEDRLLDDHGKEHHKINENVLIEIGAAMALYGRNFILLVPKGLHLPSNLQGLYRCEYEGETLDYEATMRLLKAFNDFR